MLSDEVYKMLKEEKLDFGKLLEAVKNDKLPSDLLEHTEDEDYRYSDYEDYPPQYWDKEAEIEDTNEAINHDETNSEL